MSVVIRNKGIRVKGDRDMVVSVKYHIDNTKTESANINAITAELGDTKGCFIRPINILGGGGKYGRTIKGMKGISITHYITIPNKVGRYSTKDIGTTRRVLADKDGTINIERIKQVIVELVE